jgi:AmmeMemoRadiSam system protein B
MKRTASVAGTFYPGRAAELRDMVRELMGADDRTPRLRALAVVSPHAGYVYSGAVAGAVFSSVEIPATCVILGPAHREIGPRFAIQKTGAWETPLGEVPIDDFLAGLILAGSPLVRDDPVAHRFEHSLEVQVPFLQVARPDVSIVPICVSYEAGYGDLEALGRALAGAVTASGREALLVASTDMSHYISRARAAELDGLAIERILRLDPRGLYDVVERRGITMCGVRPTTAVLVAARELGASRAGLVRYATSGEVTGDDREVVGYAGITVV